MPGFLDEKRISNELAWNLIQAAQQKAEELGIAVNITVVDQGGNPIAFSRMDQAPILSIKISQNKAYSAAAFGIPTHEWYEQIKDQPSLKLGIVHTENLIIFGGGYPIWTDGQLAGAIGVSGGTEEEDRLCCEAALKLLEKTSPIK